MNFYEHTIIARQDISPAQLKQVEDKYKKIISNNEGNLLKTEKWGLMQGNLQWKNSLRQKSFLSMKSITTKLLI